MVKRSSSRAELTEQFDSKRLKVFDSTCTPPEKFMEITSRKQLQQLLTFNQDLSHSLNDIQSFKSFLDAIIAEDNSKAKLLILKEYFETQKSYGGDESPDNFLNDLIKTWSFASQSNKENLLSAVPAVLALLLRIISNSLELSTYGIKLGRNILHKDQHELIKRGLSANKNKEHMISPILRLLRELSMLDGGALADSVYKARNATFQALTRNLTLKYTGNGIENPRRPSVRTNTIRFVLQLVRYLSTELKRDFLSQRDIFSKLNQGISNDPPFLVRDILETFQTHVVKDTRLPRDAKTKLLSSRFLANIASLYGYDKPEEKNDSTTPSVSESAHDFLLLACSSPDSGVLLKQSGLYPRGLAVSFSNENTTHLNSNSFNLGLDSIGWINNFSEKVPVRNIILSEFIHGLRPWSSIRQTQLITTIFKAAPELIAEYLSSKNKFLFDPKLTASWMAYSNFIYNIISLPLPSFFGFDDNFANLPPPLPILMNHILPQNFSQKLIVKNLSYSTNKLIVFFTVRILCLSFRKLKAALQMFKQAIKSSSAEIWNQYASIVIERFSKQIPAINHVTGAYRRLDPSNICQREIFTKLISLYYEILPHIALETNSGVSSIIADALFNTDKTNLRSQDGILHALELENIFRIAGFSPGMRWFSSGNGLLMSPFLAMLRLFALAPQSILLPRLRSVLISIVHESQILQTSNSNAELDFLIINIRASMDQPEVYDIFKYLDSCISRCAATPTKYIFMLEELISETKRESCDTSLSLLSMAMLEQWPFYVKAANISNIKKTSYFVSRYLAFFINFKKDKNIVKALSKKFITACADNPEAQNIIKSYREVVIDISTLDYESPNTSRSPECIINSPQVVQKANRAILETSSSNDLSENNNALVKWRNKDIEDIVEDGHLKKLILLLSSKYDNIRREALINISKVSHLLKESKFEERDQIWLLLQELHESVKTSIDQKPLASIFSYFAYYAVDVLKDPSHFLYPKINQFLSQKPIWQLDQIPLMHRIMDEAPNIDSVIYSEREWLLNLFFDGLRSEVDLEIFRKRLIFERILSCYNFDFGQSLQDKILNILSRACSIKGGTSTLVTRFSLVTWLEVHSALSSNIALQDLHQGLLKLCAEKRVKVWSKGTIESM
ncbi:Uncharacterized protein C14G10.02 [Erysiphe neolycopersici]|uniref:Uncharacterized protein C14G10.02 n=1 Tax=Erysiphe neolycopersici TaxID=212602 RepID=A0A420HL18_9PEZI|nr:Uncharacterized protein C14G10.02 [Erysiphe neolycopersici]